MGVSSAAFDASLGPTLVPPGPDPPLFVKEAPIPVSDAVAAAARKKPKRSKPLTAVAANTTDGGPLKLWLPDVRFAHVLMVSEHKCLPDDIAEFSTALKKNGVAQLPGAGYLHRQLAWQ